MPEIILQTKSDLEKIEESLKEKIDKTITREEFEELKSIVKQIIIKLQTRNF